MYMYMYMYMYTYVYIYTHTYIHTYIYTYITYMRGAEEAAPRKRDARKGDRGCRPRENRDGVNMVLAQYPQNTLYHWIYIIHD